MAMGETHFDSLVFVQRAHVKGFAQGSARMASRKLNGGVMKTITFNKQQSAGKVGWVLLWLLGVPIPVLLILFLLRGCT